MSASQKTVQSIVNTLLRYVNINIALRLANELFEIEGNKSFRDTIQMIQQELETR